MSSLRWQTAIAFALMSAAIAVVMSFVVYRTSVDQRDGRLRDLAVQRARSAATIYGSTGALVSDATLNDPSAPRRLRVAVAGGHSASELVGSGGALTVWAGAAVGALHRSGVFVNASAAEDARALRSLRTTLAITTGLITLAGAAGGTLLALGLSRRLRTAADAARAIAAGDLHVRVGAHGQDEVGTLSEAMDAMADALAQRLERERQFNAEVAHELRTPITGLLAAAALLPDDDPATVMVRDRGRRLHRLVEDLLEISRLHSGREVYEPRRIDLRALADDVAARYDGVAVTGRATVDTDPRRLERVVANLVENALTHGAPPVRVAVSPHELSVTDAGPGFPVANPDELLERFVTHSRQGHGLGLAIAYHQARLLGARLRLDHPLDGGARATLTFA